MLRIIEVRTSPAAKGEYVVLQNQGITTTNLRGWALCSDSVTQAETAVEDGGIFIFTDDVPIRPYVRVVLFTDEGANGWCPTVDGKQAYLVYQNRGDPAWAGVTTLHLLQPAASFKIPQGEEVAA